MEVQRTNQQRMICVCRLTTIVRPNGMSAHDVCTVPTSGIDEPVCEYCVAARHHEMPNFDPIIKAWAHD